MTRGFGRAQLGITEQMLRTYGETVWTLSHNIQVRRGDPVRLLDWEQIEAQRPGTGLADIEIAARIGLTREQVTHIRLMLEHRRFRRGNYHRLNELGGGRRFRAERFVPVEERAAPRPEATALRAALAFDPRLAARCLEDGLWRGDTPANWLAARAAAEPEAPALAAGAAALGYGELFEAARSVAAGLAARGLRRGDAVALLTTDTRAFILAYVAIALGGYVVVPLPTGIARESAVPFIDRVHARILIADAPAGLAPGRPEGLEHVLTITPARDGSFDCLARTAPGDDPDGEAVAADPAAVLFAPPRHGRPRAVVHNAHTLLAGVAALAGRLGLGPEDALLCPSHAAPMVRLLAANLALAAGASILSPPVADGQASVVICDGASAAGIAAGRIAFDGEPVRIAVLAGEDPFEGDYESLARRLPGADVCRAWVMAETQCAFAASPAAPEALRHATVGMASPAMTARFVAQGGEIRRDGGEGALELSGANVAPAYYDDAAANRAAYTGDGWLRTGFRAVCEADGYVRVTGLLPEAGR